MGKKGRKRKTFIRKKKEDAESDERREVKKFRKNDVIRDRGEMENELFEIYYKGQDIVAPSEWNEFMASLKQPLPQTFRVTGIRRHAKFVANCIETIYFRQWKGDSDQGEEKEEEKDDDDEEAVRVVAPQPLPWYPDQLAWTMPMSKKHLRKSPALSQFHQFLISETEQGNISRQETVSVIPPLLLDVKPSHKVLDMCAAPGSKTAQLVELLHGEDDTGAMPSGFVVANDKDNKRCYMLVHQTKRLLSPCCIITNEDASIFPNMYLESSKGQREKVEYDRILCDVPCSGDGTLRKNVVLWKRWIPTLGTQIHRLQQRILWRGIEMLTVGGRLVYSTCSLNPVENEAVVAALLQTSEGAVELVDVSQELIQLKRSPGLHTWKVMSKLGMWFSSYSETPDSLRAHFLPTMFPPSPEAAADCHLERCIRILPHHQNTGCFFIAVLAKKRPVPWQRGETTKRHQEEKEEKTIVKEEEEEEEKRDDVDKDARASEEKEKPQIPGHKENPFFFLKGNEPVWPPIKNFFGLDDDFPVNQLMVRSSGGKKKIYATSERAMQLVQLNEKRIKIINVGVRVLDGAGSKGSICPNRLAQEGLSVLLPYLKRRQVYVPLDDMAILLRETSPNLLLLTESSQKQLTKLDAGSIVFTYDSTRCECERSETEGDKMMMMTNEGVGGRARRVDACGWMGTVCARLLISKSDRNHFLLVLGLATPDDLEDKKKTETKVRKARQRREEEEKEKEKEKEKEETVATAATAAAAAAVGGLNN